jgi:hypothetical protein
MPGRVFRRMLASVALRTSIGSRRSRYHIPGLPRVLATSRMLLRSVAAKEGDRLQAQVSGQAPLMVPRGGDTGLRLISMAFSSRSAQRLSWASHAESHNPTIEHRLFTKCH